MVTSCGDASLFVPKIFNTMDVYCVIDEASNARSIAYKVSVFVVIGTTLDPIVAVKSVSTPPAVLPYTSKESEIG